MKVYPSFIRNIKGDLSMSNFVHFFTPKIIYQSHLLLNTINIRYNTRLNWIEICVRFSSLVNYISSGPVLAMELLAPSAISKWRQTLGPTDSSVARNQAPNSLRAHFGLDKSFNAAHGSDSVEAAQRVWREFQIDSLNTSSWIHYALLSQQELNLIFNNQNSFVEPADPLTLCLIKPHSIQEGTTFSTIVQIMK